jgi:hypothetical protein
VAATTLVSDSDRASVPAVLSSWCWGSRQRRLRKTEGRAAERRQHLKPMNMWSPW